MPVSTDAGYSGLWNGEYGIPHQLLPITIKPGNPLKGLSVELARRVYDQGALGAVIAQLVAGNVGGSAALSHKRVQASRVLDGPSQGGQVNIENFNDINRVTTAQDQTDIANAFAFKSYPNPYRTDAGGNGGG